MLPWQINEGKYVFNIEFYFSSCLLQVITMFQWIWFVLSKDNNPAPNLYEFPCSVGEKRYLGKNGNG